MNELITMVPVSGGVFSQGSDDAWENAAPVHQVTIHDFFISDHELTEAEYTSAAGTDEQFPAGGETKLRWYQAVVLCNRLSEKAGLTPCYSLNETTDTAAWGIIPLKDQYKMIETGDFGNWSRITCDFSADGYRLPTEAEWEYAARTKAFDIEGTRHEWCWDWYGPYQEAAAVDPHGPASGMSRVVRGGHPSNSTAHRSANHPEFYIDGTCTVRLCRSR